MVRFFCYFYNLKNEITIYIFLCKLENILLALINTNPDVRGYAALDLEGSTVKDYTFYNKYWVNIE